MRPYTVIIGPSATTPIREMVRMDDWGGPNIAIQVTASGAVNYTIQSSMDDPNDQAGQAVAVADMTWVNSSDATVVGATGTKQTNYFFIPRFIGITLSSGTGTVRMTVLQSGPGV